MSGQLGASVKVETIEEDAYSEPDYIEDEVEYNEKTFKRKERPVSDGAYYDPGTGERRVEEPGPSKDQMRREFLAKIIIGCLGPAQ